MLSICSSQAKVMNLRPTDPTKHVINGRLKLKAVTQAERMLDQSLLVRANNVEMGDLGLPVLSKNQQ
jgi:tripartite-type tricarboxylate transporter receptor subunit TctC